MVPQTLRPHRLVPLLAAAAFFLGITTFLLVPTSANHGLADCQQAAQQPPGWGGKVYDCTFVNTTTVAVNDIEITFIDRAQKHGGATTPIWACSSPPGGGPPPRAPSTTITCRDVTGSRSIPPGGTFKITVRADVVPPLSWSWTLNGTPVPTTTHTPTPTYTPTPEQTQEATQEP